MPLAEVFVLVDYPCLVTSGSHLPKLDILDIVGGLLRLLQELNDALLVAESGPTSNVLSIYF